MLDLVVPEATPGEIIDAHTEPRIAADTVSLDACPLVSIDSDTTFAARDGVPHQIDVLRCPIPGERVDGIVLHVEEGVVGDGYVTTRPCDVYPV